MMCGFTIMESFWFGFCCLRAHSMVRLVPSNLFELQERNLACINGSWKWCASLDGDADRFVYFIVISNRNNKINLVDVDKILSLFALFIKDRLSILIDDKDEYQPRVGHGTILFSDHFLNWLEGLGKKNAAKRLWAVTKLINQVMGDALSGLLLVEAILQHMGCVYFMLLMQDLMPPVLISYVNAAIDTTAIGFKRRKVYTSVLIKRFTHHVNIPKPPHNVVSSSSALANSPAFVRPSRTPTSASKFWFGSALNIETLVAAAERKDIPIDETVKGGLGPCCIFTLTAIAKWEYSSYGRALALHARGTGFDSPHFLIFSLCD
nr:phosphoacetylglucosamine mutase [Tanacetum cinerariifolium]